MADLQGARPDVQFAPWRKATSVITFPIPGSFGRQPAGSPAVSAPEGGVAACINGWLPLINPMRYLLLNPNWSFEGSIYFGCREPHLPLEYGYSKALLERAGHEVLFVGWADRMRSLRKTFGNVLPISGQISRWSPPRRVICSGDARLRNCGFLWKRLRNVRDIAGTHCCRGPSCVHHPASHRAQARIRLCNAWANARRFCPGLLCGDRRAFAGRPHAVRHVGACPRSRGRMPRSPATLIITIALMPSRKDRARRWKPRAAVRITAPFARKIISATTSAAGHCP